MFTGIVEVVGEIRRIRKGSRGGSIEVHAPKLLRDYGKPGDSVSVNGVCLTIRSTKGESFLSDISEETLKRTTFAGMREGRMVNLEKPLAASGFLGGHFVQGHVDGVGRIASALAGGEGERFEIRVESKLPGYLVEKGSVAVDGISLTVTSVLRDSFEVALIPHTIRSTAAVLWKIGVPVNLEYDIIGKYVENILRGELSNAVKSRITPDFLREHGF